MIKGLFFNKFLPFGMGRSRGLVTFGCFLRSRKGEDEFKPPAAACAHADASSHCVDTAFDNREAEPGSSGFA